MIDVNVNAVKFRHLGRSFSIMTGSIVGLLMVALFNLTGGNTGLFINSMHNINFFNQMYTVELTSVFAFILAILFSGLITTFLIMEKKRSFMFGGITGIIVVLITMIHCYLSGVIVFPTSEIVSIFGPAGMLLDFIINVVPISMIGFFFGYAGGYLIENILKHFTN